MKVLFSNPPWWESKEGKFFHKKWRAGVRAGSRWPFTYLVSSSPDRFKFGDYLPYPFFMGYATTYVQKETGAEVHFRDSIALRESYDRYFQHLEAEQYDYIFIEIATPSWEHDSKLIGDIHTQLPKAKIVVTGPITTTKSEEILAHYPVHACIKGEYEKGSVRVLNGASGVIEHDLLTLEEMNAAPFPYFDEQYAHRYWDANPIGQQTPQAQIWSSRGCPFKCIFCVWPATMTGNDPEGTTTRTVRQYSPAYMEAFIKELGDRYHFKSIYFDDDTFNLGNKHVVEMCAVMKRIGLPWSAMCRADTIKLETWQLMKESGCFGVKLGFESGNQWVVDKIVNKHLNLDYAAEVVRELKRLGMTVHGTFTYGLPGETREQMLDTKRFIHGLPFDTFQESGTAEIEGTPLHTLRQKGKLEQYEGAQMDDHYHQNTDGSKKWQQVVVELQEN
ncbi:MAG: radical SAM protein [Stenomitos rutilans HA7619-LM2]|jgi:radical SAM superfamily enzyme YgiQ (UPF0313 family)|nr:radical SAM protein [Stenomitos rutilans HA7619-LM2]